MPSAAGRTKATSSPRVLEEEEDDEEVEDDDGRRKDSGEGAAGPSSKKRAPNFTSVEDAVIARCWKNMTNDAKTGTDQTSDVFWQRLFLKFTTVMMEEKKRTKVLVEGHRTWKTLRSRWRRSIQKECMLFGSVYRRVCAIDKSGWNDDDYVKEAMARYRAMNGKNRDFSFLECWKVLKDQPKFELMCAKPTPSDDIPVMISTDNQNGGNPEGGDESVTTDTRPAKKVRTSGGSSSFSSIRGPSIGASGHPIGVKKTKAALKDAFTAEIESDDIASERHEEVTGLLVRLGDRMAQLAKRIDVQSSFLGSFVFLQMGDTDKARSLADCGREDLMADEKSNEVAAVVANSKVDATDKSEEAEDEEEDGDEGKKPKAKKFIESVFGYCCAGKRCGRYSETGGALDRFNFSPNAGDDLEEILQHPKHQCAGCCMAFCGGTCGIGESADDYQCYACLSLP